MNQRMAVFHCSLTDRTQFDRELLNKQLDLEVLNINCVNQSDDIRKAFLESNGQCTHPAYKRDVERLTNQEGTWNRLHRELSEIS